MIAAKLLKNVFP